MEEQVRPQVYWEAAKARLFGDEWWYALAKDQANFSIAVIGAPSTH